MVQHLSVLGVYQGNLTSQCIVVLSWLHLLLVHCGTIVGLIILQKELINKSLLQIYIYDVHINHIYNDLPNLMHVTMYCYIHLRCICCYYMHPFMADCDMRVSVGWHVYIGKGWPHHTVGYICLYVYPILQSTLLMPHHTVHCIHCKHTLYTVSWL